MIAVVKTPPAELLAQCEKINKELGTKESTLILYLQDTEFEEEWRFRLFDKKYNRTVSSYLNPKTADWHTYYLLLEASRDAFQEGIKTGQKTMILSKLRDMCHNARIPLEDLLAFAEERGGR